MFLGCLGAVLPGSGARAQLVSDNPEALRPLMTPHEAPAEGLDTDARQRLFWLDFAHPGKQPEGAWPYDLTVASTSYGFTGGMVRLVNRDLKKYGTFLADFIEGDDAWFLVSLATSGNCRFVITFGDPQMARGPVRIEVPGSGSISGITTKAGEYVDVSFEVPPVAGKAAVRIRGDNCGSFAMPGLSVYAMPGSRLAYDMFKPESMIEASDRAPAVSMAAADTTGRQKAALDLLHQISWFLMRNRMNEGCFSTRGAWYESAYSTRALLAAGRFFGQAAFTDAAFDCLDRFQSEQLPGGNWASHYFGKRGCTLAKAEQKDPESANLADVGTMVLAMITSSSEADSARRERYLGSARRYLDTMVLPNQLPGGSLPNLRHIGVEHRVPYSVATAVQAAVLSAAYGETGDARYQAAADSAARFLLAGFQPDGKYLFYRHDHPQPSPIKYIRFGDMFYVMEGLLWVRRFTKDDNLAAEIEKKLESFLYGTGGISGYRVSAVLWKPDDDWEASKAGALLFILNEFEQLVEKRPESISKLRAMNDTKAWITDYLAWLSDPRQSATLGIGIDPGSSKGTFAFPASGFAGLGIASTIDPSAVYPQ